jgi:hypothetical protein
MKQKRFILQHLVHTRGPQALGLIAKFPLSLPDWSYMSHGLATSLLGSSQFDVQFLSKVSDSVTKRCSNIVKQKIRLAYKLKHEKVHQQWQEQKGQTG